MWKLTSLQGIYFKDWAVLINRMKVLNLMNTGTKRKSNKGCYALVRSPEMHQQLVILSQNTKLSAELNQYCSRTNSVVVLAISLGAAIHILSNNARRAMVSSTWTSAIRSASPETS